MEQRVIELDVAIIGGGFAGVYCGKALRRAAEASNPLRVGLVSEENYTVFQPMLPSVAAASISPRHVVNPIRQLCKGIAVYKGHVRDIDPDARLIRLNTGDFTPNVLIRFKQLVVAVGAKVDLSRVPGMPEHALLMQNVGDAMKVRATVIGRFEEANLVMDSETKRRLLTFVVVGGGYAGVETAGELLDLMHDIHTYYSNVSKDDYSVVLVHSREQLLPTVPPKLGHYCERILKGRGMKILLNQRVRAITANSVFLGDGTRLESSSVISTVGNGPHPLVMDLARKLGLETDKGRLQTDAHLKVKGVDWLWSAGDCAAVPHPAGGSCPPTAQFAQRQGTLLGRNLCAQLENRPSKGFTFKGLGELAAIGHRRAIAQMGPFTFQGFFAWWLWRTVYLAKLPGLQRKLRVVTDWTLDIFFAKDINLLNPRYSRPLKFVHLEEGDFIVKPGEPAFSLYFVKEGQINIMAGDKIVRTVRAGDYFGERALLQDRIWRYTGVASCPCTLIGLGAEEFLAITQGSTALRRLFMRSAQAYLTQEDFDSLKANLARDTLRKPASAIMNRQIDSLHPDLPLRDVLTIISARRHGSYPVISTDGELLGTLKRDAVFDYFKAYSMDKAVVKDVQLDHLPEARPETTGEEVLEILLRANRNKVLITNAQGRLEGIITLVDLIEDSFAARSAS